jgi:hypothetical protein
MLHTNILFFAHSYAFDRNIITISFLKNRQFFIFIRDTYYGIMLYVMQELFLFSGCISGFRYSQTDWINCAEFVLLLLGLKFLIWLRNVIYKTAVCNLCLHFYFECTLFRNDSVMSTFNDREDVCVFKFNRTVTFNSCYLMVFCTSIVARERNVVLENDKCNQSFPCVFFRRYFYGGHCDLKLSVCMFMNNKKEVCNGFCFSF